MKNYLRQATIAIMLVLAAVLSSCNDEIFNQEPTPKRAFIVAKTDDDNWTTSAAIDCDSVNMLSITHAVYWIDSKCYHLYAKSFIKVATNPYYKSAIK